MVIILPINFFDGQIEILVYDPSLTGTINVRYSTDFTRLQSVMN